MTRSLLAVFAHPDDESFAVGATVAKYAAMGVSIHLVTASRGEMSTLGVGAMGPEEFAKVRESELYAAARELGISDVRVMGYPDGGLDRIPLEEISGRILEVILEVRPDIVITFDKNGFTGHPDHIAIHRAVTAASEDAGSEGWSGRVFYWVVPEEIAEVLRKVSGVNLHATTPDAISAAISVGDYREIQWRAVRKHITQCEPTPIILEKRLELQGDFDYFRLAGAEGRERLHDLFK